MNHHKDPLTPDPSVQEDDEKLKKAQPAPSPKSAPAPPKPAFDIDEIVKSSQRVTTKPTAQPAKAPAKPTGRGVATYQPLRSSTGNRAFDEMYERYGKEFNVDPNLLLAQGWQESKWNPKAQSHAGARGIAQFMRGTAQEFGVNPDDPDSSIRGQARLMAKLLDRLGDVDLALAGYNSGHNASAKRLRSNYYSITETHNYVNSINKFWGKASGGGKLGAVSVDRQPTVTQDVVDSIYGYTPPTSTDDILNSIYGAPDAEARVTSDEPQAGATPKGATPKGAPPSKVGKPITGREGGVGAPPLTSPADGKTETPPAIETDPARVHASYASKAPTWIRRPQNEMKWKFEKTGQVGKDKYLGYDPKTKTHYSQNEFGDVFRSVEDEKSIRFEPVAPTYRVEDKGNVYQRSKVQDQPDGAVRYVDMKTGESYFLYPDRRWVSEKNLKESRKLQFNYGEADRLIEVDEDKQVGVPEGSKRVKSEATGKTFIVTKKKDEKTGEDKWAIEEEIELGEATEGAYQEWLAFTKKKDSKDARAEFKKALKESEVGKSITLEYATGIMDTAEAKRKHSYATRRALGAKEAKFDAGAPITSLPKPKGAKEAKAFELDPTSMPKLAPATRDLTGDPQRTVDVSNIRFDGSTLKEQEYVRISAGDLPPASTNLDGVRIKVARFMEQQGVPYRDAIAYTRGIRLNDAGEEVQKGAKITFGGKTATADDVLRAIEEDGYIDLLVPVRKIAEYSQQRRLHARSLARAIAQSGAGYSEEVATPSQVDPARWSNEYKQRMDSFFSPEEINAMFVDVTSGRYLKDELKIGRAQNQRVTAVSDINYNYYKKLGYDSDVDSTTRKVGSLPDIALRELASLEAYRDAGIIGKDAFIKARDETLRGYDKFRKENEGYARNWAYVAYPMTKLFDATKALGQGLLLPLNPDVSGIMRTVAESDKERSLKVIQESMYDAMLRDVVSKHGSMSAYYEHEKRMEKLYGNQNPYSLGRALAFADSFGRYFAKLPVNLIKQAFILGEITNPAFLGIEQTLGIDVYKDTGLFDFFDGINKFIDETSLMTKPLSGKADKVGVQGERWADDFIAQEGGKIAGQFASQMMLSYSLGAVGLMAPLSDAMVAQYNEITEGGADPVTRAMGTYLAGALALPEVWLRFKYFRGFSQVQKNAFFSSMTKRFFNRLAPKLGEDVARETSKVFMVRLAQNLKWQAGRLSIKTPKGALMNGVYESTQEWLEDSGNKLFASLTYEKGKGVTWEDIFVPDYQRIKGYTLAFGIGLVGSGFEPSEMPEEELKKGHSVIDKMVGKGVITPEQGEALQDIVEEELKRRESRARNVQEFTEEMLIPANRQLQPAPEQEATEVDPAEAEKQALLEQEKREIIQSPAPSETPVGAQPKQPERAVTLEAQVSAMQDPDLPNATAVLFTDRNTVPTDLDNENYFTVELERSGDVLLVNQSKLKHLYERLGGEARLLTPRPHGLEYGLKQGYLSPVDLMGGKAREFENTAGGLSVVTIDAQGNELLASKVTDNTALAKEDQTVVGQEAQLQRARMGAYEQVIVPTDEVALSRIEDRPINLETAVTLESADTTTASLEEQAKQDAMAEKMRGLLGRPEPQQKVKPEPAPEPAPIEKELEANAKEAQVKTTKKEDAVLEKLAELAEQNPDGAFADSFQEGVVEGVTPRSAGNIIASLQRKGLVERIDSGESSTPDLVLFTDKGRALLEARGIKRVVQTGEDIVESRPRPQKAQAKPAPTPDTTRLQVGKPTVVDKTSASPVHGLVDDSGVERYIQRNPTSTRWDEVERTDDGWRVVTPSIATSKGKAVQAVATKQAPTEKAEAKKAPAKTEPKKPKVKKIVLTDTPQKVGEAGGAPVYGIRDADGKAQYLRRNPTSKRWERATRLKNGAFATTEEVGKTKAEALEYLSMSKARREAYRQAQVLKNTEGSATRQALPKKVPAKQRIEEMEENNPDTLTDIEEEAIKKARKQGGDLRLPKSLFEKGVRVVHTLRGHGVIEKIEKNGKQIDVHVRFDGKGDAVRIRNRVNLMPESRSDLILSALKKRTLNTAIGIQGLRRHPQRKERMRLLGVAQDMMRLGFGSAQTWLSTGWNLGADGFWRTEVGDRFSQDFRFTPHGWILNRITVIPTGSFSNTVEIIQPQHTPKEGAGSIVKLTDLVDHPVLFSLYPELKDYHIILVNDTTYMGANAFGAVDVNTKHIFLNVSAGAKESLAIMARDEGQDSRYAYLSVILHEIQHAVQAIEGYQSGASSDPSTFRLTGGVWERLFEQEFQRTRQENIEELKAQIKGMPYAGYTKEVTDEFIERAENELAVWEDEEGARKAYAGVFEPLLTKQKRLKKKPKKLTDLQYGAVQEAYKDAMYNLYISISGEVEARRTQDRANMTEAERALTPLEDSESVPREDQFGDEALKGKKRRASMAGKEESKFPQRNFDESQFDWLDTLDTAQEVKYITNGAEEQLAIAVYGLEETRIQKEEEGTTDELETREADLVYQIWRLDKVLSRLGERFYDTGQFEMLPDDYISPHDTGDYYHDEVVNKWIGGRPTSPERSVDLRLFTSFAPKVKSWFTPKTVQDEIQEMPDPKRYVAPNGKKSNLHPVVWKLVRTNLFKKFYGDWEQWKDTDPRAIHLLDENGEPLFAFHGGNSLISEVKLNSRGVFYTTVDAGYASFYADEITKRFDPESFYAPWRGVGAVFKGFVAPRVPFDMTSMDVFMKPMRELIEDAVDLILEQNASEFTPDRQAPAREELIKRITDGLDTYRLSVKPDGGGYSVHPWQLLHEPVFNEVLKELGFDGIILKEFHGNFDGSRVVTAVAVFKDSAFKSLFNKGAMSRFEKDIALQLKGRDNKYKLSALARELINSVVRGFQGRIAKDANGSLMTARTPAERKALANLPVQKTDRSLLNRKGIIPAKDIPSLRIVSDKRSSGLTLEDTATGERFTIKEFIPVMSDGLTTDPDNDLFGGDLFGMIKENVRDGIAWASVGLNEGLKAMNNAQTLIEKGERAFALVFKMGSDGLQSNEAIYRELFKEIDKVDHPELFPLLKARFSTLRNFSQGFRDAIEATTDLHGMMRVLTHQDPNVHTSLQDLAKAFNDLTYDSGVVPKTPLGQILYNAGVPSKQELLHRVTEPLVRDLLVTSPTVLLELNPDPENGGGVRLGKTVHGSLNKEGIMLGKRYQNAMNALSNTASPLGKRFINAIEAGIMHPNYPINLSGKVLGVIENPIPLTHLTADLSMVTAVRLVRGEHRRVTEQNIDDALNNPYERARWRLRAEAPHIDHQNYLREITKASKSGDMSIDENEVFEDLFARARADEQDFVVEATDKARIKSEATGEALTTTLRSELALTGVTASTKEALFLYPNLKRIQRGELVASDTSAYAQTGEKPVSPASARASASSSLQTGVAQAGIDPKLSPTDALVRMLQKAMPNISIVADHEGWARAERSGRARVLKIGGKALNKTSIVMGMEMDGTVYLNPDQFTPNTAIHELGHVWLAVAKLENPALYERGLTLIKESPYYKAVEKDSEYKKVSTDPEYLANEALARMIGDTGQELLASLDEAEQRAGNRLLNWLTDFFEWIQDAIGFGAIRAVTPESFMNLTLEEYVHNVTIDLLKGQPLTSVKSSDLKGQVTIQPQFQLVHRETGLISVDAMLEKVVNPYLENLKDRFASVQTATTHLSNVMRHIHRKAEDLKSGRVTARDVAKAYLIAVASINAGENKTAPYEETIGMTLDPIFTEKGGEAIRPEGAMAHFLLTEGGERLLQNVELGKVDETDRGNFQRFMKPFGGVTSATNIKGKVFNLFGEAPEGQTNLTNLATSPLMTALREGVPDEKAFYKLLESLRFIKANKVGFVAHFLGLGRRGVVDDREIKAWVAGVLFSKEDAVSAESTLLTPRQKQAYALLKGTTRLGREYGDIVLESIAKTGARMQKILGWSPKASSYLAHHLIWDAYLNERNTHAGLYFAVNEGDANRILNDTSQVTSVRFSNPMGEWLGSERERASSFAEGGTRLGGITAVWQGRLPTAYLTGIGGANQEHERDLIQESRDRRQLYEDVRAEGVRDAIMLAVDKNGDIRMWNGNHRLALADHFKQRSVPVYINFHAGGELKTTRFSPETLENVIKGEERMLRTPVLNTGIKPQAPLESDLSTQTLWSSYSASRMGTADVEWTLKEIADNWGAISREYANHPDIASIQYHLDVLKEGGESPPLTIDNRGLEDGYHRLVAHVINGSKTVRAIGADGILLAPNGKPSNLNPYLYLLVRTPEFKAWFGDWENDPENASKVVDENGEPLVVYHGTFADFDTFRTQGEGDIGAHFGTTSQASDVIDSSGALQGLFDEDGIAETGRTLPVFLNIRSPIRLTDTGSFYPADVNSQAIDQGVFGKKAGYTPVESLPADVLIKRLQNAGIDGGVYLNRREGDAYVSASDIPAEFQDDYDEFALEASDEVYKQFAPQAEDSWIAFQPTQIKSIFNNGEFNPVDERILNATPLFLTEEGADATVEQMQRLTQVNDLSTIVGKAKSSVDSKTNTVKMNAEMQEIVRTLVSILENVNRGERVLIAGAFLDQSMVPALINALEVFAKELEASGIDPAPVEKMARDLKRVTKETGTGIIRVFETTVGHEQIHMFSELGSRDEEGIAKDLEDRYSNAKDIAKNSAFQKFRKGLEAIEGAVSLGVALEEAMAYLGHSTQDYIESAFGLTEDEVIEVLALLLTGYAEANGVEALLNFKQADAERIQSAVEEYYAKVNEKRKDTGEAKRRRGGKQSDKERSARPRPAQEPPARDAPKGKRERGTIPLASEAGLVDPDALSDDVIFYSQRSQDSFLAQGQQMMRDLGFTEAFALASQREQEGGDPVATNALKMAVMEELDARIAVAQRQGNDALYKQLSAQQVIVASSLATTNTMFGQAIAMLARWSKYDPKRINDFISASRRRYWGDGKTEAEDVRTEEEKQALVDEAREVQKFAQAEADAERAIQERLEAIEAKEDLERRLAEQEKDRKQAEREIAKLQRELDKAESINLESKVTRLRKDKTNLQARLRRAQATIQALQDNLDNLGATPDPVTATTAPATRKGGKGNTANLKRNLVTAEQILQGKLAKAKTSLGKLKTALATKQGVLNMALHMALPNAGQDVFNPRKLMKDTFSDEEVSWLVDVASAVYMQLKLDPDQPLTYDAWKRSVSAFLANEGIPLGDLADHWRELQAKAYQDVKDAMRNARLENIKTLYDDVTTDEEAEARLVELTERQKEQQKHSSELNKYAKEVANYDESERGAVDNLLMHRGDPDGLTVDDVLRARDRAEFINHETAQGASPITAGRKYLDAVEILVEARELLKQRRNEKAFYNANKRSHRDDAELQKFLEDRNKSRTHKNNTSRSLARIASRIITRPTSRARRAKNLYLKLNSAGETLLTTALQTATHNIVAQFIKVNMDEVEMGVELAIMQVFGGGENDEFGVTPRQKGEEGRLKQFGEVFQGTLETLMVLRENPQKTKLVRNALKQYEEQELGEFAKVWARFKGQQMQTEQMFSLHPELWEKMMGTYSFGELESVISDFENEQGRYFSEKVGDIVDRYVRGVVAFNTWQERHIRASMARSVIYMELRTLGFDPSDRQGGRALHIASGTYQDIPATVLEKAVYRALDASFGDELQGQWLKHTHNAMRYVPFFVNPLLFRRFAYQSGKWVIQHSPLMLPAIVASKEFRKPRYIAKMVSGGIWYAMAVALLSYFAPEDDDDEYLNVPFTGYRLRITPYNPLTSVLWQARIARRWWNGKPMFTDKKVFGVVPNELTKLVGIDGRYPQLGFQLWADAFGIFSNTPNAGLAFWQTAKTLTGRAIASYLTPLRTFADATAQGGLWIGKPYEAGEFDDVDNAFWSPIQRNVPFARTLGTLLGQENKLRERPLTGEGKYRVAPLANQLGFTLTLQKDENAVYTPAEELANYYRAQKFSQVREYRTPEERRRGYLKYELFRLIDKHWGDKKMMERIRSRIADFEREGRLRLTDGDRLRDAMDADLRIANIINGYPPLSESELEQTLWWAEGEERKYIETALANRRQNKLDAEAKAVADRVSATTRDDILQRFESGTRGAVLRREVEQAVEGETLTSTDKKYLDRRLKYYTDTEARVAISTPEKVTDLFEDASPAERRLLAPIIFKRFKDARSEKTKAKYERLLEPYLDSRGRLDRALIQARNEELNRRRRR